MLAERLKKLRDFSQERNYKQFRTSILNDNCMRTFKKLKYNLTKRSAALLDFMCKAEDPIVFKDEQISFIRTKENLPQYYNNKILKKYYGKHKGRTYEPFHNICPDYNILLNEGLENKRKQAEEQLKICRKKEEKIFLCSIIQTIDWRM